MSLNDENMLMYVWIIISSQFRIEIAKWCFIPKTFTTKSRVKEGYFLVQKIKEECINNKISGTKAPLVCILSKCCLGSV